MPRFRLLWMHRKQLAVINGVFIAGTVAVLLFVVKPYFESTITILPEYGANVSMLGQLTGLASLSGFNVGSSTPAEICQELVTSESVLAPVIYAKYKTEEFPDSVDLIQYDELEPDQSLPASLQKRAMFLQEFQKLSQGAIVTDINRLSQILNITVSMPEGQLSADVANNIAKSLDNYILTQVRTGAKDQRRYIEKRLGQVEDSLAEAENALKAFNEANRVVGQSPDLQLQQSRLQRNVNILNTVYLQLAQQAELAKIQEVKDTPVINVEEVAENPVKKAGPRRTVILVVLAFLFFVTSSSFYLFSPDLRKYYALLVERFRH